MNKNELVSAVAEAAKLSKGDAQSAVDAVFSVITGELKNGGDVRLVGFGSFVPVEVDGLVAAALALYVIGWVTASAETPAHGLFPA